MKHYVHNTLIGVSVLPALLCTIPATADIITERQVITENTTYNDLTASNIASTTANNGGVFYMQDVPNVLLAFNGEASFSGNSLNNGGMGGVIGNGWLSSISGSGYTQGGKIIFSDNVSFQNNSTNNTNGGGAIFNYGLGNATSPDIIFYGNTEFNGNSATTYSASVYAGGGAINHRNGMLVFNGDTEFTDNESASQGGAIISAGDIIFNGTTSFDGNSAGANGGAMAIMGGTVSFDQNATFTNNNAPGASAIYISQSANGIEFLGNATFFENTGVGTLVNYASDATITFTNGATFNQNTNSLNGSLVNSGKVDVTSGDFIFTNNTGSNGGGLKNSGTVTVNTNGNILFNTNTTSNSAGAFDNGGTVTMTGTNISFVNNASDAGYSGAIFNAGDITISGKENIFSNNTANDTGTIKSGGGAIHNRGNTNTTELVIGTNNSINRFNSNISKAYGGAIVARAFDGSGQDSKITINGKTYFSGNQSVLDGGAIWNMVAEDNGTTGTSVIVFNGDTTFENNTSSGKGGAIYNNDTITFNGITNFSVNTASGVTNDIHNDGTVNFNNNANINGGIDGTGILNIASGAILNIGTSDITQGEIILNGTMMATLRNAENAQITVNNENGFSGSGTLKLAFDQAGTYHVFGNQPFDNIDITNPIYDLSWNGGDVTATIKSAQDIAIQNNLTPDAARVISGTSGSSSAELKNLSVLFQEKLSSGTNADIAAVEQASATINPDKESVTQSSIVATQNSLTSVISDRISMAGLGRNGGDMNMDFGGIWAQGLYNKTKLNNNFNGYTRGITAGIDGIINDMWTIGAGYMFAHSDVRSNTRDTDIDSSSIFVYGQYKPSAWYMNAIANYTMSDYEETGNALGVGVSADYDIDVFGATIATGYNFIGGITPELSMRYMHINSSDYTNSLGIKNHFDDADYLTIAMGTKYEFDVYLMNGWVFRPQMHYAVKYDLISDEHNAIVTMPGVNSYILGVNRLSRIANEVGIAIGMNYRGLEMSLNYDIEARADYTSQTGRVKFRYEF